MTRRTVAVAFAFALVVAAAGCGGGDKSTLGEAEHAMAQLDAGKMSLELSATAEKVANPVGFRVEGSFSFAGHTDLPVFDMDYTQLLGADKQVASIKSDGSTVVVEADGTTTQVGPDVAKSLRMGDGSGFADLGIASWVENPKEQRQGDDVVVSGTVDAADLLSDLARIVSQVAGEGDVKPLTDDDAARIAKLVKSSAIEVVANAKDHLPSSVDATIDFGGDVPPKLVDSLGPYAAAKLHLKVALSRLDHALTVQLPR
jgi:hypothetical protein